MEKLPHALDTLLQDGDVRRLFGVLRSGGAEGRLVGGCVRDALLGRPITDIDVAVNRPPEVVQKILEGAGLRTIPTGLSHGTLTVLVGKLSVEITSLRRDIVTDGRHAEVAFTDQWEQDAARRDFTINALYCDEGGHIYDYFSGQKDLNTGQIRFIGPPQERIQEDFLRILRYYRFQLRYGKSFHVPSHQAVREQVSHLHLISTERIQSELFKMLAHTNPVSTFRMMSEDGVFRALFGTSPYSQGFENLRSFENFCNAQTQLGSPDELTVPFKLGRLFSLFPENSSFFRKHFRLSRQELKILKALDEVQSLSLTKASLFSTRFRYGDAFAWLWCTLQYSKTLDHGEQALELRRHQLHDIFKVKLPEFPLQGSDLLANGWETSKELGNLLKACEQKWIETLGTMTREEALRWCRKFAKAPQAKHNAN